MLQMKNHFIRVEFVITAVLLIIIASLFFTGCNNGTDGESIKIVAHRGAMSERPENTMVAFKRAHELGADIVEISNF